MKMNYLRFKKAAFSALFVLLMSLAGLTKVMAQDITVGDLNYTINEDGVSVTLTGHVNGTDATGQLVIPASVEYYGTSYAVTAIANVSFSYCSGLTGNLVIPNSVETIGVLAFRGCSGLTGTLTLSENLVSIADGAFYGCKFTGTLTIPASVTHIGGVAFWGTKFSALVYNATNIESLYNWTYYDDYSFWCYDVSAFQGLSTVTTLSIGDNVQRIPHWAFRTLNNLSGPLTIPNSVSYIGSDAFLNCSGFTGTLTIPNSVTFIGSSAFSGCTGFTGSLDIPNAVTEIGSSAFNSCSGMTGTLTIGNAVTSINNNAFANTSFSSLHFNATNCTNFYSNWLSGVTTLQSLSLGEGVRRIPDNFLTDFSTITGELTIPNAVTYIGASAFAGCTGLTGTLTLGMSLTEIGNSAFFGSCANLTSFMIRTQVPPALGSNVFTSAPANIPVYVPCTTLNAYQEASIWGNFVNLQEINPCEWTITVTNNALSGSVSGAGIYTQGQTCTLTAMPNEGFYFVKWTENGQVVSTDACYSFVVEGDRNLAAHFASPNFIVFADPVVENICISNWDADGDGLLSYAEAAAVTDLGEAFRYNRSISSFDELQYFTGLTTIGYYCFADCNNMNSIILPDNVVTIGEGAFSSCSSLVELTIPESVLSIGNYAFNYCRRLTEITIPESVLSIGYYAFAYCTSITEITIPESVISINAVAFRYCSSLAVVNYNAIHVDLESAWSYQWFWDCPSLTTVNIGENVESIPTYAFRGLGLTTVHFNARNCTSMENCFSGCSSFTNLIIGDEVQNIPQRAFFSCTGLSGELVIPNSVTAIGDYAFYGCSGLTGDLEIPNSMTTIGLGAFERCVGLNGSLSIGNAVTSIGEHAFYGCQGLAGVLTIPEAVTSIGGLAFFGTGFNTLNYNAINCGSLYFEGEISPDTWGSVSCLYGMNSLTTLNIGSNVQTIPNGSFNGFSSFTGNLVIPNSVTAVGYDAFYGCIGFTGDLVLSDALESIGDFAFYGCSGLESITIGTSVTSIGYSAFGNTSIGTVHFNATNCEQMYFPFLDCNNLTHLTIGNNVQRIPAFSFVGCNSLTGELIIPNTVTTIGSEAFEGCGFTGSLLLPNALTSIGRQTFRECTGFTGELVLPNSLTDLGDFAFWGCNGFTGDLVIPNSLNIIPQCAFYNCSGLNGTLTIGTSVTSIHNFAFDNCAFSGLNYEAANCEFIGRTDQFDSDADVSVFYGIAQANFGNQVESIPVGAFRGCANLTGTLTLPSGLKSIGNKAFYNCYGLGGLVMGNLVETIGEEAFRNCGGIRGELLLPEQLTSVGICAFASCDEITTLYYNATHCNVMGNAQSPVFYDCGSIQHIHIGENVESIPDYAFKRCSTVTDLTVAPMTPPTIYASTFGTVSRSIPVYVPFGSGEDYRVADYWEEFYNIIEGIGESPYNNHWHPNSHLFDNNMTVIGVLQIDGIEQHTNAYEIGAFCGEDCRGSELLSYYPQIDRYLFFLTLYGDQGDRLTFRLYDHGLGEVSVLGCTTILSYVPNDVVGTYNAPYVFNFINMQNAPMDQGWNWYSTYVSMNGSDGLEMMETSLGENGVMIKSQEEGFTAYDGCLWTGNLQSVNNESMYLVNTNADCVLSMMGNFVSPAQHPITLSSGWSWIGYPSAVAAKTNDALANLTATDGDVIKSQHTFSTYAEGIGWMGSLKTLTPGMGLMYNSKKSQPMTFVYAGGSKDSELLPNLGSDHNHWVPNTKAYPHNMSVMAVVELDGMELRGEHYELAAFADGECRGSVTLMHLESLDRDVAFLTVSGDEAVNLTWKLFDADTELEVSNATSSIVFDADAIVGSLDKPMVLRFVTVTGIEDALDLPVSVYPNPIHASGSFMVTMPATAKAQVEMVNLLGAVVKTVSFNGASASLKAPETPGVYMVKVTVEGGGTKSYKLIVE